MRAFLFFILVLLASCRWQKEVEVGGIPVPDAVLAAADAVGFDYTGHLDKGLRGEPSLLVPLLTFNEKTQSGGFLPEHGQVLFSVFNKLGDGHFSKALQDVWWEEKLSIWAQLESTYGQPLREMAPLTWAQVFPESHIEEQRGLYVFDRKMSTFRLCGDPNRQYVAIDETGEIERNHLRLLGKPYPGQAIFALVRGMVSPHFGTDSPPANFAGYFYVTEIIALEAKNSQNTCLPFEVWGFGHDPAWEVQVSSSESLIEFHLPSSYGPNKFFPFVNPVDMDTATVYESVNESTGDNIRVSITSVACQGDTLYPMTVKAIVNGTAYRGCGTCSGSTQGCIIIENIKIDLQPPNKLK